MHQLWSIPPKHKNARKGQWIAGPGAPLFEALKRELGELPIIAEDLGYVTPEALRLRDQFRFPGMRIMQFGFGGNDYNLPHTYVKRCVAYTGTHDNETIAGWLKKAPGHERKKALAYVDCTAREFPDQIVRWLLGSVADTVIFPTQDLLGLGDEGRMNVPGTTNGNWSWRLSPRALSVRLATKLRRMSELYGRI
jgi:4-alpha-glucanotransferase